MTKRFLTIFSTVLLGTGAFFFVKKFVRVSYKDASVLSYKLPKTMEVAYLKNESERDNYQNFSLEKTSLPVLAEGEVLVKVASASFATYEFAHRKNLKNGAKFVPCSDFSGVVVGLSNEGLPFELGEKVFGHVDVQKQDGACAEYVKVNVNQIAKKPFSLGMQQAAVLPTIIMNLYATGFDDFEKIEGKNVLIDDAVSENGVTIMTILAKFGANVTAVDNKSFEPFMYSYGAKKFVAFEDFVQKSKEHEGKYDIVFDLNGGLKMSDLAKMVKKDGVMVSYASDEQNAKSGSSLNVRYLNKMNFSEVGDEYDLLKKFSNGEVPITVSKQFHLKQMYDAFTRAAKGSLQGRVLVNVAKFR
jgi:NADPH:quinone reductase-like Zn-dependent oxidoreductase